MVYEEYAPAPEARATVSSFWRFELEAFDGDLVEHVVPPDGTASVTVALERGAPPRAVVVGPRLVALRVPIRRGVRYVGIRCAPAGGTRALLGVSPGELRDCVTPLVALSASRAADVATTLSPDADVTTLVRGLQRLASHWLRDAPPPDPVVAAMVGRVLAAGGDLPMAALGENLGVGYRQCLRRFTSAVGLLPKEFARLVRIREVCARAIQPRPPRWADAASDAGFADQAHLSREFRDVFGWPPSLVREYLARIEHILDPDLGTPPGGPT